MKWNKKLDKSKGKKKIVEKMVFKARKVGYGEKITFL